MSVKYWLGIDTSAYTTSAALACEDGNIQQVKRLLPVAAGERGLRQSDAVFAHVKALPEVLAELYEGFSGVIAGVGVSSRPRDVEGSYMPCFLAGVSAARSAALACGAPYGEFSHQAGHIMAALYSADRLDLRSEEFLAFHVSGGTHELLRVTPATDPGRSFDVEIVCATKDISAGQVIDRVGVALGCPFPSGPAMEALAEGSDMRCSPRVSVDSDGNCNLSGAENTAAKMTAQGAPANDTALFTLECVRRTVEAMTDCGLRKYPGLPVLFAGGVMSNRRLKAALQERFGGLFAKPEFSSDNAAGIAILAMVSSQSCADGADRENRENNE